MKACRERTATGWICGLYEKARLYVFQRQLPAIFRVSRAMIGDVIDLFGKDVVFSDETEESVTVSVYTNEMSAAHFAQSFAPDVTVLEPKKLRETVKNQLQQALEKYQ